MKVRISPTTQKVIALGIIFLLWAFAQYQGTQHQGSNPLDESKGDKPQNSRTRVVHAAQTKKDQNDTYSDQRIPTVQRIPREAHQTIELIRKGGPFLHDQDGVTFFNRERKLPQKYKGYYREYTVRTPGVHHRGARRIVTGVNGELYYTDDHYRTFTKLAPP